MELSMQQSQLCESNECELAYPQNSDQIIAIPAKLPHKTRTSICEFLRRVSHRSSLLVSSEQLTQCSSRRFLDEPFSDSSISSDDSEDDSAFNFSERSVSNKSSGELHSNQFSGLKGNSYGIIEQSSMEYSSHSRELRTLGYLPSYKEITLLGEKTPTLLESVIFDDGIDEIEEEFDENTSNAQHSHSEDFNHRQKVTVNPIFHCKPLRLQFREDIQEVKFIASSAVIENQQIIESNDDSDSCQ